MISNNELGNCGRLGNQMFQFASLKGIARKHDYNFVIPPKSLFGQKDKKVFNENCSIYDVFGDFNVEKAITNFPSIQENSLNFNESLFINCPDNVNLEGYFQTEKYFIHIEQEIREDFIFKTEFQESAINLLKSLGLSQETISMHIRRGDYVTSSYHHPLCTLNYYENALKEFDDTLPVIIFSDDSKWCKQQSIFNGERFFLSDDNTPGFDLCLMTLCNYHIIANSSFSWWGAWLAKSKKVVCPKLWFGEGYSDWKLEDRILNKWIAL